MKILIYSFLAMVLSTFACSNPELEKPNIIVLLTDDQRYNALGCMGNDEIQTPNIDRIAEDGLLFTNYYNTTAICMASRATIMTGLYEYKSGCNFSHGPLLQERFEMSYPMLLKEAGYKVGFAGKLGFAVLQPGMKENSSYHTMDRMPVDQFDWWRGWPGQGYYQTDKNEYMKEYAEEYPHVSAALGAAASDFIKEYSNAEEPFCLSVSFKAPHSPTSPDKRYDDVYKDVDFTEPCNFGEQGAEHLPPQAKTDRQYLRLKDKYLNGKYDGEIAKYYQLIYGVDQAVGMILAAIEEAGVAENTIILFTSDNGYFCGSHAFGGKVLPYEEGSRAPLLIYDPSSKSAGKKWKANTLAGNIDIAPTILDMAGLEAPAHMDGVSLKPVLEDPSKSMKEDQLFVQAWGVDAVQSLSVIHDGFKYIYWYYGEGMEPAEELYDLSEDCLEMTNLAKDPTMSARLEDMRKRYDKSLEKWKNERVTGSSYERYDILFDRHIPWDQKTHLLKKKKN
ncbi:sulfatase [Bacteroidota bacterium]